MSYQVLPVMGMNIVSGDDAVFCYIAILLMRIDLTCVSFFKLPFECGTVSGKVYINNCLHIAFQCTDNELLE